MALGITWLKSQIGSIKPWPKETTRKSMAKRYKAYFPEQIRHQAENRKSIQYKKYNTPRSISAIWVRKVVSKSLKNISYTLGTVIFKYFTIALHHENNS